MKPLNRPMFRYGGPIKEGVMSGIREPRQGYANGPGLVIRNDPNKMGVAKALKNAEAFMNVGKTYNQNLNNQAAVLPVNKIKKPVYNEMDLATIGGYGEIEGPSIKYDKIPKYIADVDGDGIRDINPEYTKNKSFLNDIFGGPFVRRNTNKKNKEIDTTLDNVPNGPFVNTNKDTSIVSNKLTDNRTAKQIQADKIQKYRDIMDIKGMNKTAAYNSLIAASQLINQEDDFKGSLKDGSLISKLIGATSKAFDKPSQTKDAIDTLILKGEIEKDIKASDPAYALDAELKRSKLAESKRALNPSFSALTSAYEKIDKSQAGITRAAKEYSKNNNQEYRGSIVSKADFNKIKENIKEESGNLDEVDIIAKWTQETIKGKDLPDGNYVVGDNIVTIVDNIVKAVE